MGKLDATENDRPGIVIGYDQTEIYKGKVGEISDLKKEYVN